MNLNPLYHLRRYRELESRNSELVKKIAQQARTIEEQRNALNRAEKEYKLLYTDWQKVVATNAKYEREANAYLLAPPKKHGKHRQPRGKK
ncbi:MULTISPECIES: hypothetical protein [Glaesserella]|uniref:Uncharacterized protein n=1 Tax=Glaesserella australis TaxID=2094024 RepID=A0A328C074_9PAST|nr:MULTISPECIES: hypothetical protein [Glaesserella]AUI65586.1 hypothetical protein CJD39_02880 [Glaesserella sp. 15-184]RAL19783.1 hypothetical protein C5N92_01965 [Glaesserella australis]